MCYESIKRVTEQPFDKERSEWMWTGNLLSCVQQKPGTEIGSYCLETLLGGNRGNRKTKWAGVANMLHPSKKRKEWPRRWFRDLQSCHCHYRPREQGCFGLNFRGKAFDGWILKEKELPWRVGDIAAAPVDLESRPWDKKGYSPALKSVES